jgi:hypothetical protein
MYEVTKGSTASKNSKNEKGRRYKKSTLPTGNEKFSS